MLIKSIMQENMSTFFALRICPHNVTYTYKIHNLFVGKNWCWLHNHIYKWNPFYHHTNFIKLQLNTAKWMCMSVRAISK